MDFGPGCADVRAGMLDLAFQACGGAAWAKRRAEHLQGLVGGGIMAEYEKKVRKLLLEHGCSYLRDGKGDHDIWYSPINNHKFPVAVKIKSRHMANVILKQSGIKYKF